VDSPITVHSPSAVEAVEEVSNASLVPALNPNQLTVVKTVKDTPQDSSFVTHMDAQSMVIGDHGDRTPNAVQPVEEVSNSTPENVMLRLQDMVENPARDSESMYVSVLTILVSQTGDGPNGHLGANVINHVVALNNIDHAIAQTRNQPMEVSRVPACLKNPNHAT